MDQPSYLHTQMYLDGVTRGSSFSSEFASHSNIVALALLLLLNHPVFIPVLVISGLD